MSDFTGVYGGNQGSTISLTRSGSLGNLVLPGETWPVLLSQASRLGDVGFSDTPTFPIAVRSARADSLNGFAPDLKIPAAHTWTVSFQRSISRDMAVEARYVGTYGMNQWSTLDYNGIRGENLQANGFYPEFRNAMANLQANNTSGIAARSGSFAYFGPGSGTVPLPVYLAYLNGSRDAGNPAVYTGGSNTWTNTTFAQLVGTESGPTTSAGDLEGNSTRRAERDAAQDLKSNFFTLNPAVDGSNVTDSGAFSDYNALQLELRRRLSKGLSANVSYQCDRRGSAFDGFSFRRTMVTSTDEAVRHAIKAQGDWTRCRSDTDALRLEYARSSKASPAAGASTASAASRRASSTSATCAWWACRRRTCRRCTSSTSGPIRRPGCRLSTCCRMT